MAPNGEVLLRKPKTMAGNWSNTLLTAPKELSFFVNQYDVRNETCGVKSWNTNDWLSSSPSSGEDASLAEALFAAQQGRSNDKDGDPSPSPDQEEEPRKQPDRYTSRYNNHYHQENAYNRKNTHSTQSVQRKRVSKPRATIYGTTLQCQSVAIHIDDFLPWIHIQFDDTDFKTKSDWEIRSLFEDIGQTLRALLIVEKVFMRPFFGMTPDPEDIYKPRFWPYWRVFLSSCDKSFENKIIAAVEPYGGKMVDFKDIKPIHRVRHKLVIPESNWIKITDWSECDSFVTNTQYELSCSVANVKADPNPPNRVVAPRTIISFDVEQYNASTRDVFPSCDNPGDVIICVNANVCRAGNFDSFAPELRNPYTLEQNPLDIDSEYIHVLEQKDEATGIPLIKQHRQIKPCPDELREIIDSWQVSEWSKKELGARRNVYQEDLKKPAKYRRVTQRVLKNMKDIRKYCFFYDGRLKPSKKPLKLCVPTLYEEDGDGLLVHCYGSELYMLLAFRDLIVSTSADQILHHNGYGYDWPALFARINFLTAQGCKSSMVTVQDFSEERRAKQTKYKSLPFTDYGGDKDWTAHPKSAFSSLSKLTFEVPKLIHDVISTKNGINVDIISPEICGTNDIDVHFLFKKTFKDCRNHKLDTLAGEFLNDHKMDIGIPRMNRLYREKHFWETAAYCYYDAILPLALMVANNMDNAQAATSRTNWLNVSDVVKRGQMKRFVSMVSTEAFKENIIFDACDFPMPKTYKGATVMDVKALLAVAPIFTNDFKAHYVNAIIDANLCPSTCMKPFDRNFKPVKLSHDPAIHTEQIKEFQSVLKEVYGEATVPWSLAENPRDKADFELLVPRSSQISRYVNPNMDGSFDPHDAGDFTSVCNFIHYQPELYMPDDWDGVTFDEKGAHATKVKSKGFNTRGVLPVAQENISANRNATRKKQGDLKKDATKYNKANDEWISVEADSEYRALEAQQLVEKENGNSMYGAAKAFMIYIALATTDWTRVLTQFSRHVTLTRLTPTEEDYQKMCEYRDISLKDIHKYTNVAKAHAKELALHEWPATAAAGDQNIYATCKADIDPKKPIPCRWPMRIVNGDTDSLMTMMFFLLPDPNGDPNDPKSKYLDVPRMKLALSFGKHSADFITKIFRKCGLKFVTLDFEKILNPYMSLPKKKHYAAWYWENNPNEPKNFAPPGAPRDIVFKRGLGKKRDAFNITKSITLELIDILFTDLAYDRAHETLSNRLTELVQSGLNASTLEEFEAFSKGQKLSGAGGDDEAAKEKKMPQVAANNRLARAYPGLECVMGETVRYVIARVVGADKVADRTMSLIHLEEILKANKQVREDAVAQGKPLPPLKYIDDNKESATFLLDMEYYLNNATSMIDDFGKVFGNDENGFARPDVKAKALNLAARMTRDMTNETVTKGRNGRPPIKTRPIESFFKTKTVNVNKQ